LPHASAPASSRRLATSAARRGAVSLLVWSLLAAALGLFGFQADGAQAWPARARARPAAASAGAEPVRARAAYELPATDTAHLRKLPSSGSQVIEEGPAQGALPGRVRSYVAVYPTRAGTQVEADFTIYPRGGGSISGRGTGLLKGSVEYPSFGGSYRVTYGSGRFAHAHGTGGFYGVLDRRTLALTAQTTGHFYY
jgi:hypothetical protein